MTDVDKAILTFTLYHKDSRVVFELKVRIKEHGKFAHLKGRGVSVTSCYKFLPHNTFLQIPVKKYA